MEQAHELDFLNSSTGEKWKVNGVTDYEIKNIHFLETEISVKCYLGNPLRIRSFNPILKGSDRNQFFNQASLIFNDLNTFDYRFNCHCHSFLFSDQYWFDDEKSIDALIKLNYKRVTSELYQVGDVALFCDGSLKVHSARYIGNSFTHKKGPEKIFSIVSLEDFKSMYQYDKVCHLRPNSLAV